MCFTSFAPRKKERECIKKLGISEVLYSVVIQPHLNDHNVTLATNILEMKREGVGVYRPKGIVNRRAIEK